VHVLTSVDDAVARWCAAHRTDALDHVVLWLASRDVYLGFIALAALVAIALSMWFGGWIPIARVALVLVAVSVLTGWLKPVIDRPRPPADLALIPVFTPSMPSSHALMTSATVVAVVMADWWASARLRRAALAVGVVGCVVIGAAMVYLGVHWLTDVLVGWVIGIGLTAALMRLSTARLADRYPSRG
jgi:membrane-associated phospholipid phosphatase